MFKKYCKSDTKNKNNERKTFIFAVMWRDNDDVYKQMAKL